MKEIKAFNSENQLLHKSLSSEKENIKKLKSHWNNSKKNLTVKSKMRFVREMEKSSCCKNRWS